MRIYRSKIGLMIILPIILIMGGSAIVMALNDLWLVFILVLLLLCTICYLFWKITYTITEQTLKINCGFLFRQSINIPDIKKIRETRNPLASPAASLDRLEIIHKSGNVMVSPKKKTDFISQLLEINPSIKLILRNSAMAN